jgi:RNA recognition motif-containing protein
VFGWFVSNRRVRELHEQVSHRIARIAIPPFRSERRPLSRATLKEKDWVQIATSRSTTVGKKLYVGNLSYTVSSSDLEQLFSAHGTVQSAQVIEDRETGRSKGFGFIEMASDDEAQAAITALNGAQHGGRTLTVNEAKPRESRGPGGGGGRGAYGGGGGGRGGYGGGRSRY